MQYLIELEHEADIAGIDESALERLAAHALGVEQVATPAELSVLLADDPTIQAMNKTYRGTDEPTDVLSFSQIEGEPFAQPEGAVPHLGDVLISIDTARRQAVEYAVSLQAEVAHLLVHGVLHLLGYDHEDAADAEVMRRHEDAILGEAHHH